MISGATSWVAKHESGSDTGKIGRCQPEGTELTFGNGGGGSPYLSMGTTAEVPADDDSAGTTGNTAGELYEPEDRHPTYVA